MTDNPNKMPLGIRLNNPGNLRPAHHPAAGVEVADGFAKYPTWQAGVFAYVRLVALYWEHLGKRTLRDFVATYAPPSENDLLRYEHLMCQFACLNPLRASTDSLMLDRAWSALDFMRAQIRVENGRPGPTWRTYPEWIGVEDWRACMLEVPMWRGQL